jgi:uroporphyrinogen-III synthase
MTPARFLTAAIVEEFRMAPGDRLLLPRTDAAPPGLAEALRAGGGIVDEIPAYRTEIAPARSRDRIRRLVGGRLVDVVVVTSASTVHGLVRLLDGMTEALRHVEIACIGPVTAAAVTEQGLSPSVVADPHTIDGLVTAMVTRYAARVNRGVHHAGDRRTQ